MNTKVDKLRLVASDMHMLQPAYWELVSLFIQIHVSQIVLA